MRRTQKIIALLAAMAAVLAVTGCGKKGAANLPKGWLSDFDEAKASAKKQGKDIFLLFSGDDWDQMSVAFKQNVVGTQEFMDALKDEYVFVNIDFSQTEYEKTYIDDDASRKQKKEAERINAEYEKKLNIARLYDLQQYPCAYILSCEGYVLSMVPFYDTIDTPGAYLEQLEGHQQDVDTYRGLVRNVRSYTGYDRALAIEELYESSSSSYLGPLESLVREVPLLDPNNDTGFVGKFILYAAYFDAFSAISDNDVEGAMQVFIDAAQSEFLDLDERQNAYYMAAYMLASGGSDDYERIESILQQAYDIDPDGEHAEGLLDAINQTRRMAENAANYRLPAETE